MYPTLTDTVTRLLISEPSGLSSPELRQRLRHRISQPTLWRVLNTLRSEGRIVVTGRARATRYRSANPTDLATQRSLHMHRAVARRLAQMPTLRKVAIERLEQLRRINPHGRAYHDRWARALEGSLPSLLRLLTEESESASSLRKESPFTTLVTPADRRRAFYLVR